MSLPSLESLKKVENVEVSSHLGLRTVRCQLTGALLSGPFAAVPVPKKNGKVTWRGVFVDYETVMTYVTELLAAGHITQELFNDIQGRISQHLDFTPTIASGIRYTDLAPIGTKTFADWRASYAPSSLLTPSAFWAIPSEKTKSDSAGTKEKRYNGFRAVANKTGISTEGQGIAFTTNNVASVVAPWGDEEAAKEKSFSFLVSMDGSKPPKKVIVAQVPTPQHQAKVIGHPGAKDGMEVFVLESTSKPKKIKKEPEAQTEEKQPKKKASKEAIAALDAAAEAMGVKKIATKKRKVTATA